MWKKRVGGARNLLGGGGEKGGRCRPLCRRVPEGGKWVCGMYCRPPDLLLYHVRGTAGAAQEGGEGKDRVIYPLCMGGGRKETPLASEVVVAGGDHGEGRLLGRVPGKKESAGPGSPDQGRQ